MTVRDIIRKYPGSSRIICGDFIVYFDNESELDDYLLERKPYDFYYNNNMMDMVVRRTPKNQAHLNAVKDSLNIWSNF